MMTRTLLLAGALLFPLGGVAQADDHLFQAEQNGLSEDGTAFGHTHAFEPNSQDHNGDEAPGQGSPFTGDDTQTPATDTDAANEHATVKPRGTAPDES